MREFVKIYPKFWIGPTGREIRKLGANAQIVALYLMSSPHVNYIGIYQLPMEYLLSDTGLTSDAARDALLALEHIGFSRYDAASETAWVINGARWQVGECMTEGDKRRPKIKREYSEIPRDCRFKTEFLARYGAAYHMTGEYRPRVSQPRAGMSNPGAVKSAATAYQAAKREAEGEWDDDGGI